MQSILKDAIVALVPDDDEIASVQRYLAAHENDVYELVRSGKTALALRNQQEYLLLINLVSKYARQEDGEGPKVAEGVEKRE